MFLVLVATLAVASTALERSFTLRRRRPENRIKFISGKFQEIAMLATCLTSSTDICQLLFNNAFSYFFPLRSNCVCPSN
jgi:hypothetical protein